MKLLKCGEEIRSLRQWRSLAPPERPEQWCDGRSAKEFAHAWLPEAGTPIVPIEVNDLLSTSPLGALSFLRGEPEALIRFDDIRNPRHADLAAVARGPSGHYAVTFEAKERESFYRPIGSRLQSAIRPGSQFSERITRLCRGILGTEVMLPIQQLYYQLLYGAAASMSFAQSEVATAAVFIIFEFRTAQTPLRACARNQAALDAFVDAVTNGRSTSLSPGRLLGPLRVPGNQHFSGATPLYIGKVVREVQGLPRRRFRF